MTNRLNKPQADPVLVELRAIQQQLENLEALYQDWRTHTWPTDACDCIQTSARILHRLAGIHAELQRALLTRTILEKH